MWNLDFLGRGFLNYFGSWVFELLDFTDTELLSNCLFLIWVDCFEGIKLIKVDWVTIIPYRG